MTKKSRQKLKYLENEKSFWGEMKNNEKHFSSFLKGFQLPKIVSGLRRFFKLFKRLQYILESFCAVFGMADISKYSNIWWSTHLYVSCFHQTSPILDGTPTSIFHFFCGKQKGNNWSKMTKKLSCSISHFFKILILWVVKGI